MLTELRVENLGIIDELSITLGEGLTVITGETGAGKTLLVDALELLCGARADPAGVREGAEEARVEGRFLAAADEVVVARVVPRDGRSRGYLNGRMATASELTELGRRIVDLHGQHAHQSLLLPVEQRALLDRFAGDAAARALDAYRGARGDVRALTAELGALGGDERMRAREIDLLRHQLAEITEAAADDADEDDRLARETELLADAETNRDALALAYAALEGPAEDALGTAVAALAARAPFADLAARVRGLQSEVAEAARDVRGLAESVVSDPARLQDVQARRAALRELMRKYGPTLRDVAAFANEARVRLDDLEQHDTRAAALESSRAAAAAAPAKASAALGRARRTAAGPLGDAVTEQLRALAMPAASFAVEVGDAEPTDDGADDVVYSLAPNPGEPPRPLARAASGGELSRAMLALRVVCSAAPPTLVFDEVDAGIGGEAGAAVGRALATLGRQHQVLCVTHLAQVAADADAHIAVTKESAGGRTVARAALLLGDARVNEISRMLAGVERSAHARRHARELLAQSRLRS